MNLLQEQDDHQNCGNCRGSGKLSNTHKYWMASHYTFHQQETEASLSSTILHNLKVYSVQMRKYEPNLQLLDILTLH
ncbi:hypothetical protein J6590_015873 [Homalodisca vitripennis]|nr:hypothetical protein J6590_015873 [Homalodisca vitripennis]